MAVLRDVVAANAGAFAKLRAYSVLLFAAGLGAFFFFRAPRVAALFGVTSASGADALGAAAGVLATNAVIALYVVSAFREPDDAGAAGAAGARGGTAGAADVAGAPAALRKKDE